VSDEERASSQVRGERDTNSVTRVLSVQTRVSNLLAIGFMSILGLGSLTWYYAGAMMRQDRAKQSATAAATSRAQGDMPLPSLGRIDTPAFSRLPQDNLIPAAQTLPETPMVPDSPIITSGVPLSNKTPKQPGMERELSGAVFSSQTLATLGPENTAGASATGGAAAGAPGGADGGRDPGELTALLRPTPTGAVRARVLPARRLLLPKGAFIDCTLETAIDSALPGMTTCVMATDAFGVDGNVVLLERGTKLIGETRGQVQQGAARVFVLWTEARTPAGVIVPLDSPGADELGRSGLPGEVNRHFWQRFGAAMLVSVIDGAVQAAAQTSGGGGNVIVNQSASQDVLTEILKNTINIPPTVVIKNGDRIQVLVARDLDFRSVYELRSVASAR